MGLLFSFFAPPAIAAPQSGESTLPPLIEVYWKSTAHLGIEGVSDIVVLDPEIAEVNPTSGGLEFIGASRGETVVLLTVDGKQMSTRVRVVPEPQKIISPAALQRQEELAHGTVSSTVQTASNTGTGSSVAIVNSVNWSQMVGDGRRFDFASDFESDSVVTSHAFNIRHAAAFYTTPHMDVHIFDFFENLTGGTQNYASQFSGNDSVTLRGASVAWKGEKNSYTAFGGTTVPYYYLVMGSTRDVAGFAFERKQTENLSIFANSTFINSPVDITGMQQGRRNSFMQTASLAYHLRNAWHIRAVGGISNDGALAEGEVDYNGHRLSAFAAVTKSSPMFPLNQLQSIFSGTSYIKGGVTFRNSDRFGESFFYEHTVTQPAGAFLHSGTSDYISPGMWVRFMKNEDLNLTYTHSEQSGGFQTNSSTGDRVNVNLHSQFGRVSNSAQFDIGSLQDSLQLNSEDQFSFNDSLAVPVKGGNLMFGFQHSRTSPSLVSRVNAELGLLTPALQQLFLQDPVSFVNSSNLPPDIRALVEASQPVSTGFNASGQFRLGSKLMLTPTFSFVRASSQNTQAWTPFFGYGINYQLRPTIQLNSSMTNVWVVDTHHFGAQRSTIFSFGITKSFAVTPFSFSLNPMRHGRLIEGRVFRDNNISGNASAGEPGLAGVQVRLDDGQTTLTDKEGRYRFHGVSAGLHQVSIGLEQFDAPVRMTTPSQADVDLIRDRQARADFGIINFARVMGNVYNDLRFHNVREPDAKGMPSIKLTLEGGSYKRSFATEGTGDYELDDVPPGQYTLSVDANSLPANYSVFDRTFSVLVTPVSTVIQDVPVRALRSISGTVYLQIAEDDKPGSKPAMIPMPDLQITAGYGVATTDKNGEFLLRDLPSGDLTITLVPVQPLPAGIKVPSGRVHMPAEPVQIQGAKIVISNPDLVQFLIGKTAKQVRDEGVAAAAAARRQMNQ